jgi:hypothetical protein
VTVLEDETPKSEQRRVWLLRWVGRFLLLFFGFMAGWFVWEHIDLFSPKNNTFVNAKFAQILVMCPAILGPMFLLDWVLPGTTIRSILHIHDGSSTGDKAVAAAFLGWIVYCLTLSFKGGF